MDFETDPRYESIESLMKLLRKERWERELRQVEAEAERKRKQDPRKFYKWEQIDKEMPEILQSIIQDFARPLCRGDWRTCKSEEAHAIHDLLRDKQHEAWNFLGGAEFLDIVIGHTFYELLKNYPGQTLQLRRVWV